MQKYTKYTVYAKLCNICNICKNTSNMQKYIKCAKYAKTCKICKNNAKICKTISYKDTRIGLGRPAKPEPGGVHINMFLHLIEG